MPPILKEFNLRHPKVQLDIRFEDSDQAFSAVEHGDIEFAVITLPNELPEKLIKETIWQDQLNIMVGLEHPLSSRSEINLEELAGYPCVLPSKDTETHKIIDREFEQQGLKMQVQMETNNLETLKMLVGAGLGWSLLPKTMFDESLQVLKIEAELTRELGVVVHQKRSLSNAASALLGLVRA